MLPVRERAHRLAQLARAELLAEAVCEQRPLPELEQVH